MTRVAPLGDRILQLRGPSARYASLGMTRVFQNHVRGHAALCWLQTWFVYLVPGIRTMTRIGHRPHGRSYSTYRNSKKNWDDRNQVRGFGLLRLLLTRQGKFPFTSGLNISKK